MSLISQMSATTTSDECFLFWQGQRWPCRAGDVIGRAGTVARNALRPVEVLSRRHLVVDRLDGRWWLTALPDSRNETCLDGAPMCRGHPYPLDRIQLVRVDTFECHLGVVGGEPTQIGLNWPSPPASIPAAPAGPAFAAGFTGLASSSGPHVPRTPAATPLEASADEGTLEDLPVPAVETDGRLAITASNAAARALLGESPLGRDLDAWAADPTSLRSRLLAIEPGGKLPAWETRLRAPAGERLVELTATRFDLGLLVLMRDVSEFHGQRTAAADSTTRLARQLEVLAELSLAPAFAAGDLAQGLTLLTHRAADALACQRVSVWLPVASPAGPSAGPSAGRRILRQAVFDASGAAAPGGETTDIAYCPHFFDALASSTPWASAEAGSPVMDLLREIGFAGAGARSLLCVGLPGFSGVLAFERMQPAAPWSDADRQFASCLASQAALAVRTAERAEALDSLRRSGDKLTAELEAANRYVQRILPEPIEAGPVTAEWQMQPSEALGGDSFGYHRVGPLFVMYVLDVVGHGTGMALHSISVLNNVRARLLLGEEAMADPAGVLGALNAAFPMENQNNMLFSMWYGVFDTRTRRLTYASAGHPPAILLHGEPPAPDEHEPDYATLGTEGPSVGALEGVVFTNASVSVTPGSKLFLFTDGAFEIPVAPDREWTFEEFIAVVRSTRFMPGGESTYLLKRIGSLCAEPRFPDDFTIVRFSFEA